MTASARLLSFFFCIPNGEISTQHVEQAYPRWRSVHFPERDQSHMCMEPVWVTGVSYRAWPRRQLVDAKRSLHLRVGTVSPDAPSSLPVKCKCPRKVVWFPNLHTLVSLISTGDKSGVVGALCSFPIEQATPFHRDTRRSSQTGRLVVIMTSREDCACKFLRHIPRVGPFATVTAVLGPMWHANATGLCEVSLTSAS